MNVKREKSKGKKAHVADIVELRTPAGLAYIQYTFDRGTDGQLVRVLPGFYSTRPSEFSSLARQRELYFVFYTLNYALRQGDANVIDNQPVPEWAKDPPPMRLRAFFGLIGKQIGWRIVNAADQLTPQELTRRPVIKALTPEQKKLSIYEIWPHGVMVKQLARAWTPERAEELSGEDAAESKTAHDNKSAAALASADGMRHFLYFSKRVDAERAGEQLRGHEFAVEVRRGADGETWLALATKASPRTEEEMDDLRIEMEALAQKFGGQYDGWEASLRSIGSGGTEKVH
jgi:hypothetical protein